MSFRSILAALRSARLLPQARPAARRAVVRPRRTVLAVEALEDRAVPSTFTVTNLLDDGSASSLRSAINQANAAPGPDTIAFARGLHGTVALDPTRGELDITGSLTIDGPGANRLTVSGNDASRVFSVSGSTTDVEIRQLTIAHGRVSVVTAVGPFGPVTLGGGLLNTGARVRLSHVTLSNNQVTGPLAE